MTENKHPEEVINHCIDNKVSIEEGYAAIIDKKLNNVDKGLYELRREIEFAIEDALCSE